MSRPYNLSIILPILADHSMKHEQELERSRSLIVRQAAFRNVGDLQKHLEHVLYHPNTKSFSKTNNCDFFFNKELRTYIVINPNKDSSGKIYGGTTFRSIVGDGAERAYNKRFDEETERLGKPPFEHQKDGILALHPDIAREHLDQQKQAAQNNNVAEKTANLQNHQQKNQDKVDLAHKTSETAASKDQENPPASQQQKAAQEKNVPQPSEIKKTETADLAAGKSETTNQTKQPAPHQPATNQLAAQKNQSDKTIAASGGKEAKTSSPQQNASEGQGKGNDNQISKPETANQAKQQELGKGQVGGEKQTTPSVNQATQPASEAKTSSTGATPKPDQQAALQQPSNEAKTNQAAVSPNQSTQTSGRSEALQKIYDRQPQNQSERVASNQAATEQKTVPENQQNQQSALVGNKDQAAVKDQPNQQNQQVNQQKTDGTVSKENTQQLTQSERTAPNQPTAEQKTVPENQQNQQTALVGNKDQSTQQPQSAKAEEGKAEKQDQSGQSQALQNMYQRQEQQAQAMEAPQQQSSAPETG